MNQSKKQSPIHTFLFFTLPGRLVKFHGQEVVFSILYSQPARVHFWVKLDISRYLHLKQVLRKSGNFNLIALEKLPS